MKNIVFVDTEVSSSGKVKDIGAVRGKGDVFHSASKTEFTKFIKKSSFIIGHNIINHDAKYIKDCFPKKEYSLIDTLFLSPLLFPQKPYHKLVKDDKLLTDSLNNPVNDSEKCRDLFYEEVEQFNSLPSVLKGIYTSLLMYTVEFSGFFEYVSSKPTKFLLDDISDFFKNKICVSSQFYKYVGSNPIELAYALAIIYVDDKESLTPPWVHMNYPIVEEIIHNLRGTPCGRCNYCLGKFDSKKRLKEIFNYDSFRKYNGEPLQENAVNAAISGKSLLAVFPTGGGKSLAFQLPALIAGDAEKALTVVISPLQSLMKDQIDNLEIKAIIDAVTINGMIDPIERKDSIEKLFDGKASILYIAPESLRSKTIEKILLSRTIARFVIDEAHCFSSWGQDFRVDYLFIAKFIKRICEKKNLSYIPVSCFTATAKQKVISDICDYFKDNLNLNLELFATTASRQNLHYKILPKNNEEEKYQELRNIIIEKNVPTIVYVSTVKRSEEIAKRLSDDGITALPYNGRMDRTEKAENQNKFKVDNIQVIVATSAFGMGVDKSNVGLVIHFDISNSLENYVQEAGRAGRDENIEADCYVLFCEEDLDRHFILLNQTKLNMNEIQQIWQAIKNITKTRPSVSISALELARFAGWDDQISDTETRVRTAISALENVGYIERGMNSPRIFATGILVNSVAEARKMITNSPVFEKDEIEPAVEIIGSIVKSKAKGKIIAEDADSRVDYISDKLGYERKFVIDIVNKLKDANIIADSDDMVAIFSKTDTINKSKTTLSRFIKLEKFILSNLKEGENFINLKELNCSALKEEELKSNTKNIKTILGFWMASNYTKKSIENNDNNFKVEPIISIDKIEKSIEKRQKVSEFIVNYLYDKSKQDSDKNQVEFSLLKLKKGYIGTDLFSHIDSASSKDIEDALLYLSKIHALSLEGGVLVIYNPLQITRLELNNQIKYKKDDYKHFEDFYQLKIEQIHIIGEYVNMLVRDYDEALTYVSDYFTLEYDGFIKKYFKGNKREEIQKNITPKKYNKLFASLSEKQKQIIDSPMKYITVIAGPGSGKTRVLVHKLASLLLLEDIKTEQLLMLTFSRAAATEFKSKLIELIGTTAYYVDIKTFHSYCFDLLGTLGEESEFDKVVPKAIEMIENDEVEINKIAKSVVVIDEAQDMDADEYKLLQLLINRNDDMRVIIVGDDDQNIYEFRNSSSEYMSYFIKDYNAKRYEMLTNYRSVKRIIDLANAFAKRIKNRLKDNPIDYYRKDVGIVDIIEHNPVIPEDSNINEDYIESIVKHFIHNDDKGTVAFLTEENVDAAKILGILTEKGIPAKLIQSSGRHKLKNFYEIRYFMECIGNCTVVLKEKWLEAKEKTLTRFKDSSLYALLKSIIEKYEYNNKEIYLSDFNEYLSESKLEDFYEYDNNRIVVSTIHKAKGKEFDSVYLYLKNKIKTDEDKRTVYVGITRAKKNLHIHYSGSDYFSRFKEMPCLKYYVDKNHYPEPKELCIQLDLSDVNLHFFKNDNLEKCAIIPGMNIYLRGEFLVVNKFVFKFSKVFTSRFNKFISMGYKFRKSQVRFIVYWTDPETGEEHPIILPDLYLIKE